MARRLIGTAVTDANGEATITYTGTGAGKLNVVAESGTFVSEIYEVLDCQFYDEGTSGTPNTDWWTSSSGLTLTSDDTGLTASNTTSNTYYLAPNKNGTSTGSLNDLVDWNDFICEFTYVSHTGTVQIQTRNINGSVGGRSLNAFNLTNGDVLQLQYTNGTMTYKVNGVTSSMTDTNTGDVMIRFSIPQGNFTFKEFKIYPI